MFFKLLERQRVPPLVESNDAVFMESHEPRSGAETQEMACDELFQLDQHYFSVLKTDGRFVMFFVNLNELS